MGAVGFPWMIGMMQTFAELPLWIALPLFALFCLWTAVPLGIWGALCGRGGAAPWVAVCFTGIWWSWPAVFPFTVMLGLAAQPVWIQSAELGGVALVEVLVLLCNVLIADGLARRRPGHLALALAIPALCFVLGTMRMRALAGETTRVVRVGIVQPNIPLLWSGPEAKQAKLARLREPSARAQAEGAELIVWPENMYPWPLDRPIRRDFTDDDRILALHSLPTIFGAGSIADEDPFGYNTVFNMAADGEVLATFDKVLLVPLGEHIPIVDPVWATSQVAGMAHNFAGAGPVRFVVTPGPVGSTAPPIAVGPLVCYEDVAAGFAREVAAQPGGISLFVNLTNDTWFGAGAEPWGHLALAQFRSVEHRIPMVRSVNSGPSSAIDRAGRVTATTTVRPAEVAALVPPEYVVAEVAIGRDTEGAPTVFARGGWLLAHLCQCIAAVSLVLVVLRRHRARRGERA
jgi:apolipoprotein N-acyltransferase